MIEEVEGLRYFLLDILKSSWVFLSRKNPNGFTHKQKHFQGKNQETSMQLSLSLQTIMGTLVP